MSCKGASSVKISDFSGPKDKILCEQVLVFGEESDLMSWWWF